MPIIITDESQMGIELKKWNTPKSQGGMRPDFPEYFPRMLYMAQRRPDGVFSTAEVDDKLFGGQPGAAESWTAKCQKTVKDETELARALDQGWRESQAEAMIRHEEKEKSISTAAAHRAYEDRNMSEPAKAEIAAAEAESADHLPEIKRRPGRPRKTAA